MSNAWKDLRLVQSLNTKSDPQAKLGNLRKLHSYMQKASSSKDENKEEIHVIPSSEV